MAHPTFALSLLLAGLAVALPAAAAPPAANLDLLQKVAATYKGLKRYQFQGDIQVVATTSAGPQNRTIPFFVALDGQGRIRDEVMSGPAPGMIVSDGRETVVYNAQIGQYVKHTGNVDVARAGTNQRGVGSMLVTRLATVATGVVSVKRLPAEVLTANGAKRNCVVLEATYQRTGNESPQVTEGARRYWIDAQTNLVLRMRTSLTADAPQFGGKVEQTETTVFRTAKLDPVFADSLWVFKPPRTARAVAQFDMRADPAPSFTGQPAIDFSLTDLQGRTHSLSGLRGKTVLLDFWATWCGPCRMTMPQVAKIHAEYKDRGVEVMSINVGESAAKAGDYIAKNGYAFTTLLDKNRAVSEQYRINGIPTLVVIDASGTISDYLVGARDDKALRAALKKAGVD